VFLNYKDFPDTSLKVSVYKDMSMQVIQAINIIQQIKEFPKIAEADKIQF
jgi:Dullard-like phosphatase family protein